MTDPTVEVVETTKRKADGPPPPPSAAQVIRNIRKKARSRSPAPQSLVNPQSSPQSAPQSGSTTPDATESLSLQTLIMAVKSKTPITIKEVVAILRPLMGDKEEMKRLVGLCCRCERGSGVVTLKKEYQ